MAATLMSAILTSWVDSHAATAGVDPPDGQARKSPSRYGCIPGRNTMHECIISAAGAATWSVDQSWTNRMRKELRTGLRSGMELRWKGLILSGIAKVHIIVGCVRDVKLVIAVSQGATGLPKWRGELLNYGPFCIKLIVNSDWLSELGLLVLSIFMIYLRLSGFYYLWFQLPCLFGSLHESKNREKGILKFTHNPSRYHDLMNVIYCYSETSGSQLVPRGISPFLKFSKTCLWPD